MASSSCWPLKISFIASRIFFFFLTAKAREKKVFVAGRQKWREKEERFLEKNNGASLDHDYSVFLSFFLSFFLSLSLSLLLSFTLSLSLFLSTDEVQQNHRHFNSRVLKPVWYSKKSFMMRCQKMRCSKNCIFVNSACADLRFGCSSKQQWLILLESSSFSARPLCYNFFIFLSFFFFLSFFPSFSFFLSFFLCFFLSHDVVAIGTAAFSLPLS